MTDSDEEELSEKQQKFAWCRKISIVIWRFLVRTECRLITPEVMLRAIFFFVKTQAIILDSGILTIFFLF